MALPYYVRYRPFYFTRLLSMAAIRRKTPNLTTGLPTGVIEKKLRPPVNNRSPKNVSIIVTRTFMNDNSTSTLSAVGSRAVSSFTSGETAWSTVQKVKGGVIIEDEEKGVTSVKVYKKGDHPYGSREYFVTSSSLSSSSSISPPSSSSPSSSSSSTSSTPYIQKQASLRAHLNIIFGARVYDTSSNDDIGCTAVTGKEEGKENEKDEIRVLPQSDSSLSLSKLCLPLLDAAIVDASLKGQQPQAYATLHGLCHWVEECLRKQNDNSNINNDHVENSDGSDSKQHVKHTNCLPFSKVVEKLRTQKDATALEAIEAIATGMPRKGHTVVGIGTFRDGKDAWEELAKEYISHKLSEEVNLYQQRGGQVVAIEHLADKNPEYLKSAGGAMACLIFL